MCVAKENNIKRFVYALSLSVYRDEPNLSKVEGREGNLLSPYAITKKANEMFTKNFYELYELPTIGLRYFRVFGKRQGPNSTYATVIPKVYKSITKDEATTIYGDGLQSRGFYFTYFIAWSIKRIFLENCRGIGDYCNSN